MREAATRAGAWSRRDGNPHAGFALTHQLYWDNAELSAGGTGRGPADIEVPIPWRPRRIHKVGTELAGNHRPGHHGGFEPVPGLAGGSVATLG